MLSPRPGPARDHRSDRVGRREGDPRRVQVIDAELDERPLHHLHLPCINAAGRSSARLTTATGRAAGPD
jgi:hypothetical protein